MTQKSYTNMALKSHKLLPGGTRLLSPRLPATRRLHLTAPHLMGRDTNEMRLSARCYAVTGLAYSPPWCVNAGFIAGDTQTLVIDTGGNALAGQTVHGYAIAARPENRLRVLNTEKHFDHIG